MNRPLLKKGDLVKLKKSLDNGKMFRVFAVSVENKKERCALGFRNTPVPTSEGFLTVHVVDTQGETYNFKRRDLWRVPNQPRDKNKSPYTKSDVLKGIKDLQQGRSLPFRLPAGLLSVTQTVPQQSLSSSGSTAYGYAQRQRKF